MSVAEVWLLRGGSKKGPFEGRKVIAAFAAGKLEDTDRLFWPGQDTPLAPKDAVAALTDRVDRPAPRRERVEDWASPVIVDPRGNGSPSARSGGGASGAGTVRHTPAAMYDGDYAGVIRRTVASLIDGILVVAMIAFVLLKFYAADWAAVASEAVDDLSPEQVWSLLQSLFVLLALAGLYHAASELIAGGTPGKLLVGIRVTTADGEDIGFVRAIARAILHLAMFSGYGSVLYATNIVHLFTPRRQTLLDLVTGTVVVRR
jgi:uncharacterized RDD family membrane protein YckC